MRGHKGVSNLWHFHIQLAPKIRLAIIPGAYVTFYVGELGGNTVEGRAQSYN
jgi:hypothetical protein